MVASALDLAHASSARAQRNPLDHVALTIPQRAFVSCNDREACWRDGNQLGKSFALAYIILHLCRGTHPWMKARRPPFKVLVISISFEQMIPLMEKIWSLVPKDEIDPDNGFEEGRGITGKPPRIVFTSGPGKGSVISFATYKAGSTRVAGGTYDLVVLDEPPPESMYGEVRPRVLRRRGYVRIGFTPTPDMPDVSWLRAKVCPPGKKMRPGQIREFNFGLKEEHLQPPGYPRPWLDQEEIEEYAAGLLAHEVGMRVRGDWDQIVTGRWLSAFSRTRSVCDVSLRTLRGWELIVGMDHGTPGAGRQAAMLIAIKDGGTPRPRVVWLDEATEEGFTKPEDDARNILEMLRRNGLAYDHVDKWIGDVPAVSETLAVIKSNEEIRKHLALQLGRRLGTMKRIDLPVKHKSSLSDGLRTLNTILGREEDGVPDGRISTRCEWFAKACESFAGNLKDPLKDVLDAGRYAMEKGISSQVAVLNARY